MSTIVKVGLGLVLLAVGTAMFLAASAVGFAGGLLIGGTAGWVFDRLRVKVRTAHVEA